MAKLPHPNEAIPWFAVATLDQHGVRVYLHSVAVHGVCHWTAQPEDSQRFLSRSMAVLTARQYCADLGWFVVDVKTGEAHDRHKQ